MVEKGISKKLKVGILTTSFPAYPGHAQSPFIYELAKALQSYADIKVICPFYPESKSEVECWEGIEIRRFKDATKLTSGGGIPSNLKSSALSKIVQLFPFLKSFYSKAKEECSDCDIIHAQWALSAVVGWRVKKALKIPLVLTTRGAEITSAQKSRLFRQGLKFVLNHCDAVTPNNESHSKVLSSMGFANFDIIPNGLNVKQFTPRNKVLIRKKLGVPKDKKIILFVGWLIPRKGCDCLLRAMPSILQQNSDALLLIVGDGVLRGQLEGLSVELGIKNHISFKGSLPPDEVPYWMNVADVFVLPSISEGKPNVVGEAMASGLPVIATNVDGTPDFVEDGKDGFLIPPGDIASLSNKLKLLLGDSDLRAKIGKEARKSILKKGLSWERCAQDYFKTYQRVLSKKI